MLDHFRLIRVSSKDYFWDLFWLFILGFFVIQVNSTILPHKNIFKPFNSEFVWITILITIYIFVLKPLVKWLIHQGQRIRSLFFENRYFLDFPRFEKEWEFQGNVNVNLKHRKLQITNTPSGCLIKNNFFDRRVWKDFSADFEIGFNEALSLEDTWYPVGKDKYKIHEKIQNFRPIIAVIFRAQSLEDYFMLSFWKISSYIVFRPHVQIAGNLDIPLLNPESNRFKLTSKSEDVLFKLIVRSGIAKVFIWQDRDWIVAFEWILPAFYKINLHQGKKDDEAIERITRKIPFKGSYGQFGFRNYGEELAFVNSLIINEKISPLDKKLFSQ